MLENYSWFDFIGNLGVILLLVAYFLLQTNRITSKDLIYNILNAFGALFILISLIYDFNLSAFIIESIWLLLSLPAIFKHYFKKRKKRI